MPTSVHLLHSVCVTYCVSLQIHTASTQGKLRELFQDDDYSSLVNETGFQKPLPLLTLGDKSELVHTLRQYYTFLKGQFELNQFIEGLKTYDLIESIQLYPELMKPLFCQMDYELNKGQCIRDWYCQ